MHMQRESGGLTGLMPLTWACLEDSTDCAHTRAAFGSVNLVGCTRGGVEHPYVFFEVELHAVNGNAGVGLGNVRPGVSARYGGVGEGLTPGTDGVRCYGLGSAIARASSVVSAGVKANPIDVMAHCDTAVTDGSGVLQAGEGGRSVSSPERCHGDV